MSHFRKDRPHHWHGNPMKLILTVGLLSILAVSEITAQTGHSIATEFAMSASTEAGTTTPAQVKNACKRTETNMLKRNCQFCIILCNLETAAEDCIESCSAICGGLEFSPKMVFCCDGFWGDGCDQECPGGRRNPCNGHGKCSMKHGQCACEPGFGGTACELCTDVTKYGPNCSLDCKCEDGECNNGIHGDGLCTRENPCQSPVSPCGNNSQCIHTGAGRHRCACHDGYAGDGTECAPINPCQNNSGGCDVTTDCIYTGPNQHKCQCKEGYEGDSPDKGCTIKDMCSPGICGPNAVCETRAPLKYSCVCNEGYTWNGTLCEGNIIKKLEELNTQDTRFKDKLQYMVSITTRFYSEVLSRPGPFTIFVPTDQAFRNVMNGTQLANLLGDDNKLQQILRQHIAAGQFMNTSSSSFYNLQGNLANLETKTSLTSGNITYYVLSCDNSTSKDRSHVVEGNIEAWNGIIHVIHDLVGMTDLMSGDTQETAMDLIKTQADYSTMHSMIMAAGLSELFSRPNTTVLITNNKAWDSPSLIEKYYLKNEEEGRRKLEVILKNHVFPGVIDVTDLISNRNRKSYANIDVKVHLTDQGQIRLDGDVSITKANIPVKTGLCHRVDKVLVPSYLIPLVNNVCHVEETQKVEGHCVECYNSWKNSCPLSTDTPTSETKYCGGRHPGQFPWYDRGFPSPLQRRHLGITSCFQPYISEILLCYRICLRTAKRRTCCTGFYGNSCLPCPGGSSNPCSGNGKCSDGDRGTGVCSCNKNFVGTTCNQCADDKTFGPQCNEPCTCQFGQCDSGPEGTGKCRSGTCKFPYIGQNCDKEMAPCQSDDLCPVNATCYLGEDGSESCHCLPGYEENGDNCSMIDLCAEGRNPCHQQATCSQEGPGASKCTCNIGWHGDGYSCMPNQPCDSHPDCHPSAVCQDLEPGEYRCVCKTGYRGNGLVCTLVDLCLELNGNCHPEAQCTFIKEGERNCTCPEFMVGDGITCRQRTIAEEIMEYPELDRLSRIMEILNDSNNILDVVNTSYTFFAPDHRAFAKKFRKNKKSLEYWSQEENALSFLKFHTINNSFSTDDLMALDGVVQSYPTLYDGYSLHIENFKQNLHIYSSHSAPAIIRKSNISAVNGYIHIINQVLVPLIPDSQEPSFTTLLSSKPKYKLFYEALQKTNVLETLSSLKEYTLFVFPNDVVPHIKRKLTADFLKYHILPQRVSTNSMLDQTEKDTILGSRYRLSMKRPRSKIYVNGVAITHPDMWTDAGVIHEVHSFLRPVYSQCDLNVSETALGPCGDCTAQNLTCPDGFTSLGAAHIMEYRCSFLRFPDEQEETVGCQQICTRITSKTECCGGYYGPDCDGCPGGPEDPCSGNGVCDDGIRGSGKCKCNPGFSGELCESCERADLVPPYCSISANSCGYMNGNCSEHAWCNETGGGVTCQCFSGYDGDGYTCTPQCHGAEHGKCHPHANCAEHGKCHPHANGTEHDKHHPLVNCTEHGKCHPHANCTGHGKCHLHHNCTGHGKCHHHHNCTEHGKCHHHHNCTEHGKCHHHHNCTEHGKCRHHHNCTEHGKCHHHHNCTEKGGCHPHANCTEEGGCHPHANCTLNMSKQMFQCECNPGFHGNGTWCQQNSDPCKSRNGGCDVKRAVCNFTEPKVTDMDEGVAVCECISGYVGDGKYCSANLLEAISRIPELSSFYYWLLRVDNKKQTNITELLAYLKEPTTVFVYVGKMFQLVNIVSFAVVDGIFKLPNYPRTEDGVNSTISNRNSGMDDIKQWTLTSLSGQVINVTLNDQGQYLVNGARIVRGNIKALNGIVHLAAAPLFSSENVAVVKATASAASHATTSGVTVAVVVMLMAIIAVVIYKKRHHVYLLRYPSLYQDSKISYSKMKADEVGDSVSIPDNIGYENPLFL